MPPDGLAGLEPGWSRLVHVPRTDDVGRTWHVLDSMPDGDAQLTLLCVHGNPSWSYLFRDLLRLAPAEVRVLAVDQLEMGFSERAGLPRPLAKRVDDLCELTDELAIDGPVVSVAHDWGGPISLGWAHRHLPQLHGVVLLNTAVHQPAGSRAPSLIRMARTRALLRNLTVRSTAFITAALEMSRPRIGADVRRGFLAPYGSPESREAIATFVADIPLSPSHPSARTLDDIAAGLDLLSKVPSLLLWGSADKVFSDLYLHDLERRLPHADVHRYPRAAHFVSEDTDAMAAIVDWTGSLGERSAHVSGASPSSTLLETHAHLAEKPAIAEMTNTAEPLRFDEFAQEVSDTARGLTAAGVLAGDRVALMIPPGVDLAVTLYACWQIGAVVVLVDSGLGPAGMSAAVKSAYPAFLVGIPKAVAAARTLGWPGRRIVSTAMSGPQQRALGAESDLPTLRALAGGQDAADLGAPTESDLAAVVFTSGSTGPSKGVLYTHGQLAKQRDALMSLYDITTQDRLVAAFAPFALYGPGMGISSIVPDMDVAAPGTLSAAALGDAAVAVDATMVFASPAALANVVATANDLTEHHKQAFGRVRLLLSAGAPVRPSLLRAAAALFPNASAHTPYGMTECLPVASISLDEIEAAVGGNGVCVGTPLAGVEVQIRALDELGRAVGELVTTPGVLGEVVVRAAHARQGYDRLWHTEFAASQPPGWHSTGDVGQLDSAGRLWIAGRTGHVISAESGPIAPVRTEQAIESLDAVSTAAIVGVGPAGIQQLVAVVETVAAPSSGRIASLDLHDEVRSVVDYDIVAVFEVPKLPVDRRHNSKIDRSQVADWASDLLAGGRFTKL